MILRSTKETNHKIFDSYNLILYMKLITKLQNENIGTYEMPEKLIIPVKYWSISNEPTQVDIYQASITYLCLLTYEYE